MVHAVSELASLTGYKVGVGVVLQSMEEVGTCDGTVVFINGNRRA
jgi:hypothetical protein